MSTATIAGYGGTVTGLTGIVEPKEWSIKIDTDLQDATSFASGGFKEKTPCLIGATGSVKCVGNIVPFYSRTLLSLTLFCSSGGVNFIGTAYGKMTSITTPVAGVVEFTIDFECTANFTVNNTD
jgi:hypothetical protein